MRNLVCSETAQRDRHQINDIVYVGVYVIKARTDSSSLDTASQAVLTQSAAHERTTSKFR